MTEINPNNYPGAAVTIVGRAGNDPRNTLKNPTSPYKEVSIPINEGYKKDGEFVQTGTTWYSYERKDWAEIGVRKGDKIRIDGAKQEVREYQTKTGETKLGITLTFGEVTILESKNTEPFPSREELDDDDAPF